MTRIDSLRGILHHVRLLPLLLLGGRRKNVKEGKKMNLITLIIEIITTAGSLFFISYYKRRYSNMEINFSKDKQGSRQTDLHVHLKIDIKIMDR